MKVYFWGTCGGTPKSLTGQAVRQKIFEALQLSQGYNIGSDESIHEFIDVILPFHVNSTFGSNTLCVEIKNNTSEIILCDAGTGIRDFGAQHIKGPHANTPTTFHIFMSHLHWDHIQGFPFFIPAYFPHNHIIIHGHHACLEEAFRKQMSEPFFPVPFNTLKAKIEFDIRPLSTPFELKHFKISTIEQNHPGVSYGYRFEHNGKSVVYSTDCEHKSDSYKPDYPFFDFFRNADILIFDAQYLLAEASYSNEDWGHSSNIVGVHLASMAHVKHLVLFHHDPNKDDAFLEKFLYRTREYHDLQHHEKHRGEPKFPEHISLAYDGLEILV